MNDKQQLVAMGAELRLTEEQVKELANRIPQTGALQIIDDEPMCMAKRIEELESKYKAAMDVVRDLVELPYATGGLMERLEVRERARDLLAGRVPEQAVDAHPMQPILLDPAGCPRFKKNSLVEYLAEGRLNEIASMGYSDEDMTQLAQLIGYSVGGFAELSYVSDADYERAMLATPKPEAK